MVAVPVFQGCGFKRGFKDNARSVPRTQSDLEMNADACGRCD